MIFAHFLTQVNESNAFLVGCEETKEALLVDVADWDARISDFLETHGLKLTAIFITHDHFDHTGGLDEAVQSTGATAFAGRPAAGGVPVRQVKHGDTLRVGHLEGKVLEVPGHTGESICLVLPGMVFTGDALFAGSVGGTSSARQHQQELDGIRQHIFSLPDDYEVHTGHGPSSTVGVERRFNPFFQ